MCRSVPVGCAEPEGGSAAAPGDQRNKRHYERDAALAQKTVDTAEHPGKLAAMSPFIHRLLVPVLAAVFLASGTFAQTAAKSGQAAPAGGAATAAGAATTYRDPLEDPIVVPSGPAPAPVTSVNTASGTGQATAPLPAACKGKRCRDRQPARSANAFQ